MFITEVTLKHFRRFEQLHLDLRGSLILLTGTNGSGKSSVLEALYFSSALRSFRTHLPKELIAFNSPAAVVKVGIGIGESLTDHEVHVGISPARRLVKVDNKPLTSYKELTEYHRVIAVTEDALELIRGAPEIRRTFMDHALLLKAPTFLPTLRAYRHIVEQRNKLLQQGAVHRESYLVWTDKLLENSVLIQHARQELLTELAAKTNALIAEWFPSLGPISLTYVAKRAVTIPTYADLVASFPALPELERLYKRTLFGAHLDDISIEFLGTSSRSFASRGQQKLLVLLLRSAQVLLLKEQGSLPILLLDDFVGDLDQERAIQLLHLLRSLQVQLIVTLPTIASAVETHIAQVADRHILLTI